MSADRIGLARTAEAVKILNMKKLIFSAILLSVSAITFITGCGDKSTPPTQATNATSTVNSPADYLGAMARSEQSAVKTIDTASVKSAVQMFQADQGRLPKDLNELVEKKFLQKIPATPPGTRINYDPQTGDVKVVKD